MHIFLNILLPQTCILKLNWLGKSRKDSEHVPLSYRWLLYPWKTEMQEEQQTEFPTWMTHGQMYWLQRVPGGRQGLALAERAVSGSSSSWAPCHSHTGRCQGERAAHGPRDSAGSVLPLLAQLPTKTAVQQSPTGGPWATPLSCSCLSRALLSTGVPPQVAAKKQKGNYLCINASARAGSKCSTSMGDGKQKGNFLHLLITRTWALIIGWQYTYRQW